MSRDNNNYGNALNFKGATYSNNQRGKFKQNMQVSRYFPNEDSNNMFKIGDYSFPDSKRNNVKYESKFEDSEEESYDCTILDKNNRQTAYLDQFVENIGVKNKEKSNKKNTNDVFEGNHGNTRSKHFDFHNNQFRDYQNDNVYSNNHMNNGFNPGDWNNYQANVNADPFQTGNANMFSDNQYFERQFKPQNPSKNQKKRKNKGQRPNYQPNYGTHFDSSFGYNGENPFFSNNNPFDQDYNNQFCWNQTFENGMQGNNAYWNQFEGNQYGFNHYNPDRKNKKTPKPSRNDQNKNSNKRQGNLSRNAVKNKEKDTDQAYKHDQKNYNINQYSKNNQSNKKNKQKQDKNKQNKPINQDKTENNKKHTANHHSNHNKDSSNSNSLKISESRETAKNKKLTQTSIKNKHSIKEPETKPSNSKEKSKETDILDKKHLEMSSLSIEGLILSRNMFQCS